MKIKHSVLTLAAILSVVAHVPRANAETTETGKRAMVAAGKIMFENRCHVCHSDDAHKAGYGPSLIGVFDRKAGTVEGFGYSDALKNSGLVWNEASLRAWIENNTALLPGTRMRHVGITDRVEQDFILEYLKSLVAN
jgi:cytochrome c